MSLLWKLKSRPRCGFLWQSRLSSSLCYLHFATSAYTAQTQCFPALPPFTEQTVWQVLPNNGQQNTDTVARLTEVRVNIAGTPNQ